MPEATVDLSGANGVPPAASRSSTRVLADAVADAGNSVGNGLNGWSKSVANMTAVGVALALLSGVVYFLMDQAREDRKIQSEFFRSIQTDHKESIKDAKELQKNMAVEAKERARDMEAIHTRSFEKLGERIDKATAAQEKATQALIDATRVLEKKQ
jgi:hypothetical protein